MLSFRWLCGLLLLSAYVRICALNLNPKPSFEQILRSNPISRIVVNTYDFFYWLPRRNILYDYPPLFWKNSTADYVQWYQFPHNLPPYRYLGNAWPEDFFCYGLPGNTLPLGDWDPFGLQLVSKKVVKKYRESELKHGRLAMLATVGILCQETFHPAHSTIGGLAAFQMDVLLHIPLSDNVVFKCIKPLSDILAYTSNDAIDIDAMLTTQLGDFPLDYVAIISVMLASETWALTRNWSRWLPNEYNHQFDHNIGIGNLKEVLRSCLTFNSPLINVSCMYSFLSGLLQWRLWV